MRTQLTWSDKAVRLLGDHLRCRNVKPKRYRQHQHPFCRILQPEKDGVKGICYDVAFKPGYDGS